MAHRVLVVDDEARMRDLLALHLRRAFEVETAASGREALRMLEAGEYDVVVLDVLMPGLDGWEVCRRIREAHEVPVLMLTALAGVEDKLEAFGAGADDYLTKPFDPRELLARVEALARRYEKARRARRADAAGAAGEAPLSYPGLLIDVPKREVKVHGEPVSLTPKEFDLLVYLVRGEGTAFSREQLLQEVWGDAGRGETRTVDSHVKTLREKLGRDGVGKSLVTVWGVGYKFDPSVLSGRGEEA
ncbi:MAG: DNA-binding response regulator [Firmicutes bacterium]|nr:DNA-binding response regulator [Bacillota bacterium]MBO2521820.1 DNA-binding response regulator [Bacillota bacterium]